MGDQKNDFEATLSKLNDIPLTEDQPKLGGNSCAITVDDQTNYERNASESQWAEELSTITTLVRLHTIVYLKP